MHGFHYVYIVVSEPNPARHYTGLTRNLERRLLEHNSGMNVHSSKHRPWRLETVIAFRSRKKATAFERYLKTRSGRAFASRRF